MNKWFYALLISIVLSFILGIAYADTIVIYFSCTGTTEKVAQWIAEETSADLYQIQPEDPYTEEDLKYYTDCRADREQADDTARPDIANIPESLEQYDVIFLGYPIWHGKAPKIMYTLLDHVDMNGKTIVPFCTSGSSPIGNSAVNLQALTGETTTWLEGKRFGKTSEKSEVISWVNSLTLPSWSKVIYISVGNQSVEATLFDNASSKAFYDILKQGDLTIEMQDYGSFEKVGPLGTKIIQSDEKITTTPGDIILYQGDKITIYYAENTWTFTRLGHINGATGENMKSFLGDGNPAVLFSTKPAPRIPGLDEISEVFTVPASLITIDEEAFSGTNPQLIIIPDSVKEIKGKAFANCGNLIYLQLPSGEISFADNMLENSNDVIIVCTAGSPADEWAKKMGMTTLYTE